MHETVSWFDSRVLKFSFISDRWYRKCNGIQFISIQGFAIQISKKELLETLGCPLR